MTVDSHHLNREENDTTRLALGTGYRLIYSFPDRKYCRNIHLFHVSLFRHPFRHSKYIRHSYSRSAALILMSHDSLGQTHSDICRTLDFPQLVDSRDIPLPYTPDSDALQDKYQDTRKLSEHSSGATIGSNSDS